MSDASKSPVIVPPTAGANTAVGEPSTMSPLASAKTVVSVVSVDSVILLNDFFGIVLFCFVLFVVCCTNVIHSD